MVSVPNPGNEFVRWARAEPSVQALVLFGSQARKERGALGADAHSDWDFQIVTSRPALFANREWTGQLRCGDAIAYVIRGGRLGTAPKVTAIFATGEVDLVVITAYQFVVARWLMRCGLAKRIPPLKRGLSGLSVVLRHGYRFVIGESAWGDFFRRVATEIPPVRLADEDIRSLAEGFVCDYVSTCRKIERGELLAAQRWLHLHLIEVNHQVLHELRQRAGLVSFPDARRLELVLKDSSTFGVDARLSAPSLRSAADKAAGIFRKLACELLGNTWRWPDLPQSLR